MNTAPLSKCLLRLNHVSRQCFPFNTCVFSSVTCSQSISNDGTKKHSSESNRPKRYQSEYKNIKTKGQNISSEFQFNTFISSDKNDPNNFGSLSHDWKMHKEFDSLPDEEDDVEVQEFLYNTEGYRRLTTHQYGGLIKKFIRQKKIGNAIAVLETRMLKEDRAQPDNYIYNLLIGACGQVGYTKKAFELYRRMKDRGLKVTGHTYTGLFNACGNSPDAKDGLMRALYLRKVLIEKSVLMNQTICHAMIKAFGRCGEMEMAFTLVDEMLEKKIALSNETFNFLLQACITDKTAGFGQALMVWWKMMEKRIQPDLFTFNLLLRCSRDCGLGDQSTSKKVIEVLLRLGEKTIRRPKTITPSINNNGGQLTVPKFIESVPNLIAEEPTMGNIVAVTDIALPEHRLMLLGGSKGVLEQMRLFKVKPNIKTFTQLLDQIPSSLTAEQELLNALKEAGVSLDVDFCNILIKKRCFRDDFENAKDVLKIIQKENLKPNIMTFGVLALMCKSLLSAQQFLQDIDNAGFHPNIEILGSLLKNACFERDCDYVMGIMKILEEEELKPCEKFLSCLNNFYRFAKSTLSKQITDDTGKLTRDRFMEYCEYYQSWRKRMSPEEIPHPWSQFKEVHSEPEDLEIMNVGRVKYAK